MVAPSHLKSLQALELALRTGSLKDAARILAITPAAVGQRVKALEQYLGADLLVRGRSGLTASPALQAALPHLHSAFRDLELAGAALDLQRRSEIHVAATPDFADLWLKPRLVRFAAAHPGIAFCINGDGTVPLRLGPADCEITFSAPEADADVLFRDFVLPVSSPDISRRISRTRSRARLEGFPLMHLDFYKDDPDVPGWAEWTQQHQFTRNDPNRGPRFRRIRGVLDALFADAGLTLCGLALIGEHLDTSRLTLPFPRSTGTWTSHAFQARFRPGSLARAQIKRFRLWLTTEAAGTRQWLTRMAPAAS
jgi:LysR family transcriptional regulator, glycine cleavage system transcriptional activator